MKKLKILLDKYILNKAEKINPHLYRFLTYNLYKFNITFLTNLYLMKD